MRGNSYKITSFKEFPASAHLSGKMANFTKNVMHGREIGN